MKVHGACHCGAIRYEAELDPGRVGVCHCTDCQVLTGSAFRVSAPAPAAGFRLLSGRAQVYVKTADSGTRRRHFFCPTCGAPVFATADTDEPASYSLRIGGLLEKAHLPPVERHWCRSAMPWSQDIGRLACVEG